MVDATVPLAAAVSGTATRMLGVWQGSAAQQAAGDGPRRRPRRERRCTRSSAALLSDLDHALDEDVLVCGDRKADRAGRRRPRASGSTACAPSHCRRPRDGADRRVAHAAPDLDQRAQQDPRRDQDHGAVMGAPVVVLAGGTGGAKLARGLLDVVRRRPRRRSPTPATTSRCTARTSRPTRTSSRSGSPTASTSAAGACATTRSTRWTSCASSASTCGSTSATATSRSGCAEPSGCAEGAPLTEALAELRRALGVRARVAAHGRRAGAHARAGARAVGRLPGVHDPRARRGAGRRRRVRGRRGGARRRPPALEAIAAARAIVVGPSNPVISIRPILAVPGMAAALRESPAPVVGVSPARRRRDR